MCRKESSLNNPRNISSDISPPRSIALLTILPELPAFCDTPVYIMKV